MTRYLTLALAMGALLGLVASPARADAIPSISLAPAGDARFAPAPRWDGAHPSVVRVVVPLRDGMAFGSGTLVGSDADHGLVVTNWHVVHDAAGLIMVLFPDGFRSAAKVLRTDQTWDLAALAIWRPPTAHPVPIAPQMPPVGEPLTIAGYGPGWYRAATGRVSEYVSPSERFPAEMIEVTTGARQGDSGGPILNSRGEIAGVLWGTADGKTAGSYGGRVRQFVESALVDFRRLGPAPPEIARQLTPAPIALPPPPSVATSTPAAPPVAAPSVVAARPVVRPPPPPIQVAIPAPLPAPSPPVYARRGAVSPRIIEVASDLPPSPPPDLVASQPRQAVDLSELPSPLPAPLPAVPARVAGSESMMLSWADIAGTTRGQQAKTLLAAVGIVALLFHGMHLLAGPPATVKKAARRTRAAAKR